MPDVHNFPSCIRHVNTYGHWNLISVTDLHIFFFLKKKEMLDCTLGTPKTMEIRPIHKLALSKRYLLQISQMEDCRFYIDTSNAAGKQNDLESNFTLHPSHSINVTGN